MAEREDQEKTEQPTPFKLKEAKDKGQVSKSMEFNSLILISAMLFLSYMMSDRVIAEYLIFSKSLMEYDASNLTDPEGIVVLFDRMWDSMIDIFWPILGVIIAAGVVSNLVQTGPVFSFFPLKPDIQKINPVKGFKRLFSKRMLYEIFKTFIKIILFATVGYLCIIDFMPSLLTYVDISPDAHGVRLIASAQELVLKMLLVLLLVALIDVMYTRWDFMKQMRMSFKEIKDELKRREGDPLIRTKRKELQRQALERIKSLKNVPDADVLITNPTHLAVALQFDQASMNAPVAIAKGAGEVALKMREIARKHRVPIVENKPLARAIFRSIDLNEAIGEDMYPQVAKIYAWLATNHQQQLS